MFVPANNLWRWSATVTSINCDCLIYRIIGSIFQFICWGKMSLLIVSLYNFTYTGWCRVVRFISHIRYCTSNHLNKWPKSVRKLNTVLAQSCSWKSVMTSSVKSYDDMMQWQVCKDNAIWFDWRTDNFDQLSCPTSNKDSNSSTYCKWFLPCVTLSLVEHRTWFGIWFTMYQQLLKTCCVTWVLAHARNVVSEESTIMEKAEIWLRRCYCLFLNPKAVGRGHLQPRNIYVDVFPYMWNMGLRSNQCR